MPVMERSEFMLLLVKNTTNGASFSPGKRYNFGSGRPAKAKKYPLFVRLLQIQISITIMNKRK